MVKYGRDRDPVVGDPLGDVGVESDCEGDSSKVADGVPGVPEGRETALSRAILTVGSFSAYEYSRPSIPLAWLKQNPSGGNLYFSIVAQMRSRSLPSDLKVSILASITSVKRRWRRLHRPAPRRVYMSWQIWRGYLRQRVSHNTETMY